MSNIGVNDECGLLLIDQAEYFGNVQKFHLNIKYPGKSVL